MESSSSFKFFQGKTILVTGATGFLAKILVEKILRIQPNVGKILLLIRATKAKSALERLHDEVIGTELFRVLRENWGEYFNSRIAEKMIPIEGDVGCEDLGLESTNLKAEMWEHVDVIVNSAATTKFDERYDVAMGTNVIGAMHVMKFAKRCTNLKLLLHVSTAYVCGEGVGLIVERPFNVGETLNAMSSLQIDEEKELVEKKLNDLRAEEASEEEVKQYMKDLGIQRAKRCGWPNTYVFTKAMAEMVIGNMENDIPLVIIRPTIVTSTFKEPFPGWIEGVRTVDSFIVGYGKGKLACLPGNPESILDMFPGDMVVNSMIAAIVANANKSRKIVYHVGSSLRNPLKYAIVMNISVPYFVKQPWIDHNGKPVKVGKLIVLRSMVHFRIYMLIRYLLPLKMLQILNAVLFQRLQDRYISINRKLKTVMRLSQLYEPYLFFEGIFDDQNTETLRMEIRESSAGAEEEDVLYFDPKCIDWEDYFKNTHIPAVVRYLF